MLYSPYSVRLTPSGGSATLINGITSQSIRTGTEQMAEPTAGNSYANFVTVPGIKPGASFSSLDILTLIPLLGLRGACLAGGASPGAEFFQLALENCGTVKVGATAHRKMILPNGLAIPRSLNVQHRGDATVDCEVLTYFDGTNNPIIPTEGIAAPTGLAASTRYTLGTVEVNGVVISEVTSIGVDFGNGAATSGGDSNYFDTRIEVATVVPKITIRSRNVAQFNAGSGVTLLGLAGAHADTEIVLRKRLPSVAGFSASSDHCLITAACAINVDEAYNASANQHGEFGLILTCFDDGTNAPILFDFEHGL